MTDRAARNLLIALTIGVAVTRFLALSHSMWDWDEALFATSLRSYNVANHNPHPPGFPLFIAAAKVMRLLVHDDFRALRTLNLLMSCLIFPAMYAMARAFGFAFRTAVIGALIYSFLPNVVFFGGTAMSDISAAVTFAAGAALLLRNVSTRSFIGGSIVFAASMLIRPQNVVAAYPWFLASARQLRQRGRRGMLLVAGGAGLIVAIVAGGYAIAALKTGWNDYVYSVRAHQEYVRTVDGYRNPSRPPSLSKSMLRLFLSKPVPARAVELISIAAGLALLVPKRRHFDLLATFVPQMLFALFMLNPTWVPRFAIAYMPAHAILAASAFELLASAIPMLPRLASAIQWTLGAAAAIAPAIWVWPAIREVRRTDSPPVEATRWISTHLSPKTTTLYVHASMGPFADYYLAAHRKLLVGDDFESGGVPIQPNSYFTADHPAFGANAVVFKRRRLAALSGLYNRYFEAAVAPVDARVAFAGWYGEESDGTNVWRWMGKSAHIFLDAAGKRGRLTMRFYAPIDAVTGQVLTVSANGAVVDHFTITTAEFERQYDFTVARGARMDIALEVDRTVVPSKINKGGDSRELGLQLRSASWKALE